VRCGSGEVIAGVLGPSNDGEGVDGVQETSTSSSAWSPTSIASSGVEEVQLEKELASVRFGLRRRSRFAARLDTPMGLGSTPEREEKVRRRGSTRECLTASNLSKNDDSTAVLQRAISSIWRRLVSR
jgi:hypothetical protein